MMSAPSPQNDGSGRFYNRCHGAWEYGCVIQWETPSCILLVPTGLAKVVLVLVADLTIANDAGETARDF